MPNSFSNFVALKVRPYCRVYGLWLAPKIECWPKGYNVPVIRHSEFNYEALGELLGGLFWQSAPVQLRLPNDAIDVATFDARVSAMNATGGMNNSSNIFVEFGKIVMRGAKAHDDGVIDIRKSKSWCSLKIKSAQVGLVYPPQIVPLCVLSDRAEDTNWWYLHALEAINNPPLPLANLARVFSGKPPVTKANQGVLPTRVLQRLAEMFEVPFEPRAMLVEMASHAR